MFETDFFALMPESPYISPTRIAVAIVIISFRWDTVCGLDLVNLVMCGLRAEVLLSFWLLYKYIAYSISFQRRVIELFNKFFVTETHPIAIVVHVTAADQHPKLGPFGRHRMHVATVVRLHTRHHLFRRLHAELLHSLAARRRLHQHRCCFDGRLAAGVIICGSGSGCGRTSEAPSIVNGGRSHFGVVVAVLAVRDFEDCR